MIAAESLHMLLSVVVDARTVIEAILIMLNGSGGGRG